MAKTTRRTKAPGVVVSYSPYWGRWEVTYRGLFYGPAFRTQRVAIELGRTLARDVRCDLTVMGRNGRVRAKWSFGNETKAKG